MTQHTLLLVQTGDDQARRQFLQMEGKPELNTAEMQYALATFYTSAIHKSIARFIIPQCPTRQLKTRNLKSLF